MNLVNCKVLPLLLTEDETKPKTIKHMTVSLKRAEIKYNINISWKT